MRKRLKRSKGLEVCSSPCSPHDTSYSLFSWHDVDIWTYIARFLDGKSLVNLALTCKWFREVIMQDCVWEFASLRDLQVPDPCTASFNWSKIYATAFDGSHSYLFRQQHKHLDWMRIGAFLFDSQEALLSDKLNLPIRVVKEKTIEKMLEACGSCLLNNIKTGIWIADLQLVRCPACNLDTCEGNDIALSLSLMFKLKARIAQCGILLHKSNPFYSVGFPHGTMQMLDARHIELFLSEGFQNGSWEYELIGSFKIEKNVLAASAGIFDVKHFMDCQSAGVFNLNQWEVKPNEMLPKAIIASHAVAINTNLQTNEGILVNYHTMKAGPYGEIVSIRITQQLL